MIYFIAALLLEVASAKVKFNCYQNPMMPAMSYQLGGVNCPSGSAKGDTNSIETVFCTYSAICEPVADGETATQLDPSQVQNYSMNLMDLAKSTFKYATISCAGTGVLDQNKFLYGNCPPIEKCQRDIAFNGTFAVNNVSTTNRVTIDSQGITQEGVR